MIFQEELAAFSPIMSMHSRKDAGAVSLLWSSVELFPSPSRNFAMERAAFREHCVGVMAFYKGASRGAA